MRSDDTSCAQTKLNQTSSSTSSRALWPRTTTPSPSTHCRTVLTRPPHYSWTTLCKIPSGCYKEGTSRSGRACGSPLGVKLAYCCGVVPAPKTDNDFSLLFKDIWRKGPTLEKNGNPTKKKMSRVHLQCLLESLFLNCTHGLRILCCLSTCSIAKTLSVKSIYLINMIRLCNSIRGLEITVSNIADTLSRATTVATESYTSLFSSSL